MPVGVVDSSAVVVGGGSSGGNSTRDDEPGAGGGGGGLAHIHWVEPSTIFSSSWCRRCWRYSC